MRVGGSSDSAIHHPTIDRVVAVLIVTVVAKKPILIPRGEKAGVAISC